MSSIVFTSILTFGLLLWGWVLSTRHFQVWLASPGKMPAWKATGTDFVLFALSVAMIVTIAPSLVVSALGMFVDLADADPLITLVGGLATQVGALIVCVTFWLNPATRPDRETAPLRSAWVTAGIAFLLVLPVLAGVQLFWDYAMRSIGVEAPPQDILDYIRTAPSHLQMGLWVFVAAVLAPVAEELVLRAGLFRFLAMRMSPVRAALFSALIFGMLHANLYAFLPLVGLGFALALVYHHTGRISSSILLHALFNLNSLLFLLLTRPA